MRVETVIGELAGLRALARSLVRGDDEEADDLLQEAAVAAIEHPPPDLERPLRPWLAAVLRNRRRMDVRAAERRRTREQRMAVDDEAGGGSGDGSGDGPEAMVDRVRALERLAAALVSLEEPFRATVIRRYFDGESAAEIARAVGVPPGTVRWRLKTGLDRLRAALDRSEPRWQRAFVPLAGGTLMKAKTTTVAIAILVLLLLGAGALLLGLRGDGGGAEPRPGRARGSAVAIAKPAGPGSAAVEPAVRDPLPGQGRAAFARVALDGGAVSGRVINWSTGDGVAGAELTFTSDGGATTVRTAAQGTFELAPPAPGAYTLSTISAPGFLPYAPELQHSTVHLRVDRNLAVRGVTVFLFPAIDYHGRVVDERGAPAPGARVRLLGTPTGEQAIEKLETEWIADREGRFTFHAADFAVLEAVRGASRGWARLDGDAMNTQQLTIAIGPAAARDATIAGRVVDGAGMPVGDVLVRAEPEDPTRKTDEVRATSFATTNADGAFVLENLDRKTYELQARAEDRAPAVRGGVAGGSRDVTLVLDEGAPLAGTVVTSDGDAVPAFTLLVARRDGTTSELILERSLVDPNGRFAVRVAPGDYLVSAAASGWAPTAPTAATAGARDLRLVVSAGATLHGQVVAAEGGAGIPYARVMREARGGGASAQPANAGTVTRADGSFELTGLPPGQVSIVVGAGGYHPRIEAGMTATDGAVLGPLVIRLSKLGEGEKPSLELVGIGVKLAGGPGDTLEIQTVFPDSGAAAAGIVAGDRVLAVDGVPVTQLGVDGAVAKIRGVAGTTVSVTLLRDGNPVPLVVTRKKLRA